MSELAYNTYIFSNEDPEERRKREVPTLTHNLDGRERCLVQWSAGNLSHKLDAAHRLLAKIAVDTCADISEDARELLEADAIREIDPKDL